MADYIKNELLIDGTDAQIKEVLEAIKSDEHGVGSIDFNKIIPMPDNIFKGNLGVKERQLYRKNNWYDWSVENWGTHWNSFGYEDYLPKERCFSIIEFETAWYCAKKVILRLSEMFPDVRFLYKWANENIGNNVGEMEFKGGEICSEDHMEDSFECAQEFACGLWRIDYEEYLAEQDGE